MYGVRLASMERIIELSPPTTWKNRIDFWWVQKTRRCQYAILLNTKTKEMVIKSIHFMVWLQGSLEHAKLSIKKLQKLFGIIPRIRKKHRKNKGDEENKSSTEDDDKDDEGGRGSASNDTLVNENATENSSVVSKKRSGRIPRSEYKNVKEIAISHTDLKPGDLCPTLCGGKLYSLKPSAILKIDGASFACLYVSNY